MSDHALGVLTIHDQITRDEIRSWKPDRIDAYLTGVRAALLAAIGGEHLEHLRANPPPWAPEPTRVPAVARAVVVFPDPPPADLPPATPVEAPASPPASAPPEPPIEDEADEVEDDEEEDEGEEEDGDDEGDEDEDVPPPKAASPRVVAKGQRAPAAAAPSAPQDSPPPTLHNARDFMRSLRDELVGRILRVALEGSMPVAEFTAPHEPSKAFHVFGLVQRVSTAAGFKASVIYVDDDRVRVRESYRPLFAELALAQEPGPKPAPPAPKLRPVPAPPRKPATPPPAPPRAAVPPPPPAAPKEKPPAALPKPPPALAPAPSRHQPGPAAKDAAGEIPWTDEQIRLVLGRLDSDDEVAGRGLLRSLYSSDGPEVVGDIVRNPIAARSSIERARKGLSRVIVEKDGMAWVDYSARLAIARITRSEDVPWIQAVGETRYNLVMRGKAPNDQIRLHDPFTRG